MGLDKKSGSVGRMGLLLVFCLICLSGKSLYASDDDEHGAVYEYKKWNCQAARNDFTLTIASKITIYNPRGDEYSGLVIYENSFRELKDAEIITRDSTGKQLHRFTKKDFYKHCGYRQYSLYSDQCLYTMDINVPGYSYSIEYEYTLKLSSLFFLRGEQFQYDIPVMLASFELVIPDDIPLAYKFRNGNVLPQIGENDGKKTYLWTADSIPAHKDIDYAPAGYNEPAELDIMVQRFSLENTFLADGDWRNVGLWYRRLVEDRYLPFVDDVSIGEDKKNTAKKIYDEIINDTRYVLVDIGIGSWQPHDAALVEEYGYGDCKDLSTLLISRLRNSGINARPVLISTHGGILDTTFPNFNFNHVITVATVDGDTIWMDPTCDHCPFGEINYSTQNIYALIVDSLGGVIRKTPRNRSRENAVIRKTDIYLDQENSISFKSSVRFEGQSAIYLRNRLEGLDRDATRKKVESLFDGAGRLYTIVNFNIENMEDIYRPLLINIEADFKKPARSIGSVIYCSPFFLNKPGSFETEDIEGRTIPVNLFYPHYTEDTISVTWDSAMAVDSVVIPHSDTLSFDFGKITVDVRADGDSVLIVLAKEYTDYAVPVENLDQLRQLCEKIKEIYNSYIKIHI